MKPRYSAQTIARFAAGHSVGTIAQALYDPRSERVVLDAQTDGYNVASARTAELLRSKCLSLKRFSPQVARWPLRTLCNRMATRRGK